MGLGWIMVWFDLLCVKLYGLDKHECWELGIKG